MDHIEVNQDTTKEHTTSEQGSGIWKHLIPKGDYFITPIIMLINVLVFGAMVLSGVDIFTPEARQLIEWGANFRPDTMDNEWWRLLTSVFLHIGIIHLALNMYALVSIGRSLEPLLGRYTFIAFYLLSGIVSSLTSLYWHEQTVSAGASGAIFGLYGMFTALLTTGKIGMVNRKAELYSILIFIGYNLVFGLEGGIDNAAHIGGLLSGMVFGYLFWFSSKMPSRYQALSWIGAILLTFAYFLFVRSALPADLPKYYKAIDSFAQLEKDALSVYSLPKNAAKEQYIQLLQEGMKKWKEADQVITSTLELDLPAPIKRKNELLKKYVELRNSSFELLLKTLNENTEFYGKQIKAIESEIEMKLNEIQAIN